MNESPSTDPNAPEDQPTSQNVTPPPSPVFQSPVSYQTTSSSRWRNPWLWVSVVLLVALIGLAGYVVAQNMSDSSKNTADTAETSDTKDKDVAKEMSKDSDADVESELPQADDPYGDWSTFTGQIVSGVGFRYPNTMTVSEVDEGGGFVEINIMEKNQSNPRLILSNTPWGCVGPRDDTNTIPLAYDVLLGKEPVTISQACGDFLALAVSAIGLQDSGSLKIIGTAYYQQNKDTIDKILASMDGVSKRQ